MSVVERAASLVPWTLGCVFVAGIVHISSVLMLPYFARDDAYARFGGATTAITLLSDEAAQRAPFQDPAAVMGVCRFDLDQGATRVRTAVGGETLLAISFHDRIGRIFYSTTDRAALRGRIDIRLVDAQQLDALEAADPEDQAPQELRLVAPMRQGYVLVRALNGGAGGRPAATAAAQAVQCGLDRG